MLLHNRLAEVKTKNKSPDKVLELTKNLDAGSVQIAMSVILQAC